jgi:hypothetical protein
MPRMLDITGRRFGRLVARERAADLIYSGRPFTAWRCDCDCGASSVATASGLTRGLTKSCGCLRRETGKFKTLNITGQRYGRLTVVKRVGSRNGKALWSCDCDCGTLGQRKKAEPDTHARSAQDGVDHGGTVGLPQDGQV